MLKYNIIGLNTPFILYFFGICGILTYFVITKINRKYLFISSFILIIGLLSGITQLFLFVKSHNFIIDNIVVSKLDDSLEKTMNTLLYSGIVCFLFFIAFISIFFNIKSNNKKTFVYYFYISSAIGAIISNGLLQAFIYLEIMSIFSIITILTDTKRKDPGMTYVIVHCVSGVLMLVGVVGYILNTKYNIDTGSSLGFVATNLVWKIPALFFLIGMLMNLGFPPFSYIITECYTIIDSFSAIILTTISTKIYLLFFINIFFGIEFLYVIGAIMVIYSGICAIMNSDLRRIINYWMILHLGVIVAYCGANIDLIDATLNLQENGIKGILTTSLGFGMLSIFIVNICIGILYDLNPEYIRNMRHIDSSHSLKNKIIKNVIIVFLIANVMGLPITIGFYADMFLDIKGLQSSKLHIIHVVSQIICYVIGAKILAESVGVFFVKHNNSIKKNINRWILPFVLSVLLSVPFITFVNFNFILFFGVFSFAFMLFKFKVIKFYGKFGFDLIWIYEKISIPFITIIRIFVIIYKFFQQIARELQKLIYYQYSYFNNYNMGNIIFYNTKSVFFLVSLVIFMIVSLSILIFYNN